MRSGVLAAATVYILWGLLPIYWKALAVVPSPEIMGHRVVWSLPVALVLLVAQDQAGRLRQVARRPAVWLPSIATAGLLSINWLTYLWANNNGHIVETSLGYFINPLVNVLLGLIFLRERLRPGQWGAVALAAAGVLYLTVSYGQPPWIALTLALSFGFYALIRKTAALGPVEGLTLELSIMFVPTAAYLLYRAGSGAGAFGRLDLRTDLMLMAAGVLTCIPLVLFAFGARRVPLTTLGILQYVSPTLQFLIGVYLYGEAFTQARLIGFGFIWLALALYTTEGFLARRSRNLQLKSCSDDTSSA